jgi:Ni/Fe-hydrogenase subunit HybB-like protein
MELLRYALVFLTIALVGGLLGATLVLLLSPLIAPFRRTDIGRVLVATANGVGILLAVHLAFRVCRWTGELPSYLMYALPFCAMISNDLWRIRRARTAPGVLGLDLAADPSLRRDVVLTERMNVVADTVGFLVGVLLLPALTFV